MYTKQDLENKSGPELVTIFNSLPGNSRVKRFTNREVGIRRILVAQDTTPDNVVDPKDVTVDQVRAERGDKLTPKEVVKAIGEIADKVVPNVKTTDEPTKRGRKKDPRGTYNLKGGLTQRPFRASSGRGQLLAILTGEGATFTDLLPKFPQWTEDQLHHTIRMTSRWLGFTITTDTNGVIRATR